MITTTKVQYECRPYSINQLGYLFCGGCKDPGALMAAHEVPKPKYGWYDGNDVIRLPTDLEYRSRLEAEIGVCDVCGKSPADFPLFTNTGTAEVEHTPARIF